MRTLRAFVLLVLFSTLSASASDNNASGLSSLPPAAQANISAALGRDSAEFYAHPVKGGFEANSRGLATRFTSTSVEVSSGNARWGLALRGYGYGDALHRVGPVAPHAARNRVEYQRGNITEWYLNGPMGLEQGFTITKRPGEANGQPLTIALRTWGDLRAVADVAPTSLRLNSANGQERLHYTGLTAYDADGRDLHASLRVQGEELRLQVDDKNARYPVVVDPIVQLAKLTASDGKSGDSLGAAVAISGNVIVAGSFANAAYVFVKPPSGWKDMTQTAKLTASDGAAQDFFGVCVAISGNVIVVGAPGVNQNQGAAYVFLKPQSGWKNMTETAKLVASDGAPGDSLAVVSVSGGTVVVGALDATVNGNLFQGAAYVFTKPGGGWAVAHRQILTETAKLTASDGEAGARFGSAVATQGDTVAIGAFLAKQSGKAYVFMKPPNGWMNMTETAELSASDAGGTLGVAIATSGSTVVAGALAAHNDGAAYVYVKPDNGWANMTETAQLLPAKRGWDFGLSVAIDGSSGVIAVGAPAGNGHQNGAGDVFVFLRPSGGWQTTEVYRYRIFATDGLHGDAFAESISISGKTLAVGASAAQIGGTVSQGAAYVFAPQ